MTPSGRPFLLAALFTFELRLPREQIHTTQLFGHFHLAGHPLASGFLNNFQVVGFADVGSAWTGIHPFTENNAWDKEVITNGPMTITLDANRDPIVAGYGAGVRAQMMGYFIRLDWAWGVENGEVQPRMFYLSLSLDF